MDLTEIKQNARKVWATGNFPEVAKHIADVGELVVERAEVTGGDEVLDVEPSTGFTTGLTAGTT